MSRRRRVARRAQRRAAAAAAVCLAGTAPWPVAAAGPIQLGTAATSAAACHGRTPWSNPGDFTVADGGLFFAADDGVHGDEVWRSDGTRAGTLLLGDVDPFNAHGHRYGAGPWLGEAGGTLFFVEDDGVHGRALWTSDGTSAGTVLVADPDPSTDYTYSTGPHSLTGVGSTLFFGVFDDSGGEHLWKSDGTAGGTVLVADVGSWDAWSQFTAVGDTLFFQAKDATHGAELWTSDGTEAGTVMVKDIAPGAAGGEPEALVDVAGQLFFTADDGTHGRELWTSDGTETGTVMVKDIAPGPGGSSRSQEYGNLDDVAGTLFFTADDGTHGRELWTSDGTGTGTVQVADIRPGARGSDPDGQTIAGGKVFFDADDGSHGRELWVSDGSTGGTHLVKDLHAKPSQLGPAYLTRVGGKVFFQSRRGGAYQQLWRSDGTKRGTVLVKDFNAGPNAIGTLSAVGGTLFLAASDGVHGRELWKSDGTPAGTVMVSDINRGGAFELADRTIANTRRGTVTLSLRVEGAGRLDVKPVGGSPVKTSVRTVGSAGKVAITVTPTKAGLKKLRHALRVAHQQGGTVGRLDVTVNVTFTPCGGPGSSVTRQLTLKLR